LRIGELARRTAMTVDGIRFYEKCGLLPKALRTPRRFRQYSVHDLERVYFIRQMQELGFSLSQIRELLDLRTHKVDACEAVSSLLREKLADTRARTRRLRKLEAKLLADLRKCNEELKRRQRHKPCACPVLEEADK
jgi:MerR family transcriptional regulator, copper efflux regulator